MDKFEKWLSERLEEIRGYQIELHRTNQESRYRAVLSKYRILKSKR